MKILFNIILGSAILLGFSQCGNSKDMAYKLQGELPFKIVNASYQEWVAGVRGGGSGLNVFFSLENINEKNIILDSVFFRGQKASIEKKNQLYIARFSTKVNQQEEFIFHKNPKEEFGNKVPIKQKEFPFKLEGDEAIIGYKQNGKKQYYKFKLGKKDSALYP